MDNASQADSRRNETNLDPLLTSPCIRGRKRIGALTLLQYGEKKSINVHLPRLPSPGFRGRVSGQDRGGGFPSTHRRTRLFPINEFHVKRKQHYYPHAR